MIREPGRESPSLRIQPAVCVALLVLLTACPGRDAERSGGGVAPSSASATPDIEAIPALGLEALRPEVTERIDRALAAQPAQADPESQITHGRARAAWGRYAGDPEGDRRLLVEGVEAATRDGDLELLASYFNDLGVYAAQSGRFDEAVSLYLGAIHLWQTLGRYEAWVDTRLNLGVAYYRMGRARDALRLLEEVAFRLADLGDAYLSEEAIAWTTIGRLRRMGGETEAAREALRRAIRLRRRHGDPLGMASTLHATGRLHLDSGDRDRAERIYRGVADLYRDRPRLLANTWIDLAELELERRPPDHAAAARYLARVSRLVEEHDLRDAEHLTLHSGYLRARSLRSQGRTAAAVATLEGVMARLEILRAEARGELHYGFFSRRLLYADLLVDMEMERGEAARAFEVTERVRARGLLEDLLRRPADSEPADAEQAQRKEELRREIRSLAARASTDLETNHLRSLLDALLQLEDETRRLAGDPVDPIPLSAAAGVLRPGEVALAFWLGEERSWLWKVTSGGLAEHFELPPRRTIEASVREVHRLLSAGAASRRQAKRELSALAGRLLPSSAVEEGATLLVLTDGVLALLPFSLLPVGEGGADGALGLRHGVTRVHSLSVLAALRSRSRAPASPELFAVAAPAYAPGTWPALPASAREARELAKRFGEDHSRILEARAAAREAVLRSDLSGVTHLHFGAHAELHPELPALSAIHLSNLGPDGRRRDGALRLRDVAELRLAPGVVTLAGCRTAVGEIVRGEGALALPRAFLHAGASSVVASLWAVEDTATAELILRFYEALHGEGAEPAEALRLARLHLASDPRWTGIEHWGGFALLGDPARLPIADSVPRR